MRHSLIGDVALVTGASSGIGAATAVELARRGMRVVLAARRAAELDACARAIAAAGGQALAVPTDIADVTQVARLVERANQAYGRIDALVNNAGIAWRAPLGETPPDTIEHMLRVNLLGAMWLTRAVLPEMLARHQGAIISVCSVQGQVAVDPLYAATKFGVRGFSLALRRQLAGSGVAVSLVSPGNVRTAMTSHLREAMTDPEVIARAIANLILRPRREVVIPRTYRLTIFLDTWLPGCADLAYRWRHRTDGTHAPEPVAIAGRTPIPSVPVRAESASRERETTVIGPHPLAPRPTSIGTAIGTEVGTAIGADGSEEG